MKCSGRPRPPPAGPFPECCTVRPGQAKARNQNLMGISCVGDRDLCLYALPPHYTLEESCREKQHAIIERHLGGRVSSAGS